MQWNVPFSFEFDRKSMETEITTLSEPSRGKAIVEQILPSEEINPIEQDCESHSQGSKQES